MNELIYPVGLECPHCHRIDTHEPRCPAYGRVDPVFPLSPVYSEEDVVEMICRTMVDCGHEEAYAKTRAREVYERFTTKGDT